MNKKDLFGFISCVLLISILFTQQGTNQWKGFAFLGLVFFGLWGFGGLLIKGTQNL